MTITELALAVACAASVTAATDDVRTVSPKRSIYREEDAAEFRRKLLTTEPTPGEDPIDAVLRRILRGDYRQ